jgi:excisionase family DNA binding protein
MPNIKLPDHEASGVAFVKQSDLVLPEQYQLIDTETLAQILGLNRRTIEGWRRKRKLPFIRIGKRCVRFRLRDVFKALEDRYTIKEVSLKK